MSKASIFIIFPISKFCGNKASQSCKSFCSENTFLGDFTGKSLWQDSFGFGTTGSLQRTVPISEPRPPHGHADVRPPAPCNPSAAGGPRCSERTARDSIAETKPSLRSSKAGGAMRPCSPGYGGSGRGSAGRGQHAAPPQGPLGVVVRHAASRRPVAWGRRRRDSTSHHAPRLQSPAQAARFPRTGPTEPAEFTPAHLPLHTQLRSSRSPRQSRLSHSRPRGPAAASLAHQLGRANCVTPSECPRPSLVRLPPPAPAPARRRSALRTAGLPLSPRGPRRQARTHRPAPRRPRTRGPEPFPGIGSPGGALGQPSRARGKRSRPRQGGSFSRAAGRAAGPGPAAALLTDSGGIRVHFRAALHTLPARPGSCPAPNPEPGHRHPHPAHCPRPLVRAAAGRGEFRPPTG